MVVVVVPLIATCLRRRVRLPYRVDVDIDLLTVPDCPNRQAALDRVGAALRLLGNPSVNIAERIINDPEEAKAAGMRGSPTILVDGQDPFAGPDVDTSVSCRLFPSNGTFDGAPSVEQLVTAMSGLVRDADAPRPTATPVVDRQ